MMIQKTVLGITLGYFGCGGIAALAASPDKGIRFQWNGSGCAKSETLTPWDPMVVEIVASKSVGREFQVKRGAGASPKDARKNCDLIVSSQEPLQFALDRIEVKGAGELPADAQIEIHVDASMQGSQVSTKYPLVRPQGREAAFSIQKTIEDNERFWSVCGRALQVSTKQLVKSGATVESKIDNLAFYFRAKACKK